MSNINVRIDKQTGLPFFDVTARAGDLSVETDAIKRFFSLANSKGVSIEPATNGGEGHYHIKINNA